MTLAEGVLEYESKMNSKIQHGLTHDSENQADIINVQALKRLVRCSFKNVRRSPSPEQDKTTVSLLCSLVMAFAVILSGGKNIYPRKFHFASFSDTYDNVGITFNFTAKYSFTTSKIF